MTEPVPHTKFLTGLDEATLREVNARIVILEPFVKEYKDLVKRQKALEIRLGRVTKTDQVRRLLAQHPKGLSRAIIGEELDLKESLSGVLGELKKQGHIDQPERGIYRLTDVGHAATSQKVAA